MQIDLKEYTTKAKELEVALYTQDKLMRSYKETTDKQIPVAPRIETVVQPAHPIQPQKPPHSYKKPFDKICLAMLCALASFFFFGISDGDDAFGNFLGSLSAFFTIVFIIYTVVDWIQNKRNHKIEISEYNEKLFAYQFRHDEYRKSYEKFIEQKSLVEKQYRSDYEFYEKSVNIFNERRTKAIEEYQKSHKALTEALEDLYNEDIIFPKYRNLVAITAINEYLMSGRCDRLEGPDGAYNLYEMELRQNIVIGQLSCIVDNLEQIKNNQYSLYQELQKSNQIIDEINEEIKMTRNDIKLLNYFAKVTAMAAVAPKHYYGVIM